jgi:hypothetical protein
LGDKSFQRNNFDLFLKFSERVVYFSGTKQMFLQNTKKNLQILCIVSYIAQALLVPPKNASSVRKRLLVL